MAHDEMEILRKRAIGWLLAALFVASVLILLLHYAVRQSPMRLYQEAETVSVLGVNSLWRYMDEGKDPSIGKVWTTLNYDASFWKTGCGSFGTEGDSGADNLLKQTNGTLTDIYSYFFRYEFELEEVQAAQIKSIAGELSYKDAVVVYLNGEIIFTGNIPPGGYRTNLEAGASEEREGVCTRQFQITRTDALRNGRNVLSVEIHQGSAKDQEIYFAFRSLTLSEEGVREPDYDIRHLVLSKGRQDDALTVSCVADSEEPYRVEYLEAAAYTGVDAFSKYAAAEYMGCRAVAGKYLHQAELTHLKENTDYVYRMIRVGGSKASEVHGFSTGKNYQAKFTAVALPPDREAWGELLADLGRRADSMDFVAVIAARDGETEDVFFSDSALWQEEPGVFIGAGAPEEAPLLNAVFGSETFSLTDRDITLIGVQEAENAPSYIQSAKRTTKRAWTVVVTDQPGNEEAFLNAGANLVLQRAEEGLRISWSEGGTLCSRQAFCAEVVGRNNRLELTCRGRTGEAEPGGVVIIGDSAGIAAPASTGQ